MIMQRKVEFFAPGEPITMESVGAVARRKMRRERRLSGSVCIQMEILSKQPHRCNISVIQSNVVSAMCGVVFNDSARLRIVDAAIKLSDETGVIVVARGAA